MSRVITGTLRSRVACGEKKSMTTWMSSSLPLHPQNSPPMTALVPLLSARSLSLSNRTGTYLARPCRLNWIRYTRLFRHCAVAWESPSHPSENSRQEGHLQHLSVDLRVGVSQGRRGSLAKEGSPVFHCAPVWCQVQSGTCLWLLPHLNLQCVQSLHWFNQLWMPAGKFSRILFHSLTGKYIWQWTAHVDEVLSLKWRTWALLGNSGPKVPLCYNKERHIKDSFVGGNTGCSGRTHCCQLNLLTSIISSHRFGTDFKVKSHHFVIWFIFPLPFKALKLKTKKIPSHVSAVLTLCTQNLNIGNAGGCLGAVSTLNHLPNPGGQGQIDTVTHGPDPPSASLEVHQAGSNTARTLFIWRSAKLKR